MANLYFKGYTPHLQFKRTKPTYQECLDYFVEFLKHFSFINEDDLVNLGKYWEYYSAKKNEPIVLNDEVCEYIVFNCKNAVKHVIENNNQQNVIELLTESNFCTSIKSFVLKIPSESSFICTQNTYGLKLSLENFNKLMKQHPVFEQIMNQAHVKITDHLFTRLTLFQSLDSTGRYDALMKEHPEVFSKFTMNDISNYLGIKPETLSRLRKKKEKE